MAATKIGIVYGTESKMIRRTIVPDYDEQLDQPGWVGDGETLLIRDALPNTKDGMADPVNHDYVRRMIFEATGSDPPLRTAAVVTPDNVVDRLIVADALIDKVEGMTLVDCYSDRIRVGCTYDPATGEFTIPAYVVPGGIDKNGQPYDAKFYPAELIQKVTVNPLG